MTDPRASRLRAVLVFYAGVVFGFAFVATPAKFLAADLTTAQLLQVGSATFGVFGWVEAGFVALLLAGAWPDRRAMLWVGLIAFIVAVQHLGLRPMLDRRVATIIAGGHPEPSVLHHVYGVLSIAKLAVIVVAAIRLRPGPE